MKVYVVTTGEYSDYCIHSIWSSREKAQAYIDDVKSRNVQHYDNFNDIDEIEVDSIDATRIQVLAWVFLSDGAENGCHLDDDGTSQCKAGELHDAHRYNGSDWSHGWKEESVCGVGRDKDHALKSARDHRAKILAERAGIA